MEKPHKDGGASALNESEPKLWILVLTRFLHANRYPLRSKTLRKPRFPDQSVEGRLRAAFFFGFFGDEARPIG
jgi:hypothetical protein